MSVYDNYNQKQITKEIYNEVLFFNVMKKKNGLITYDSNLVQLLSGPTRFSDDYCYHYGYTSMKVFKADMKALEKSFYIEMSDTLKMLCNWKA